MYQFLFNYKITTAIFRSFKYIIYHYCPKIIILSINIDNILAFTKIIKINFKFKQDLNITKRTKIKILNVTFTKTENFLWELLSSVQNNVVDFLCPC